MINQTTGTRATPAFPPAAPIPTDVERDPTHLAAAEWFVRLHVAEASVEDTLAWQRWLNESPSHAEAFARIEEVSQVLRSVPPPAAVTASRLASDRYDASIPLKDWKEPKVTRFRWLPLALAAACAGVVVSVVFWKTAPPDTFTTAVGENRVITLADGSRVSLSGDTRIVVVMSEKERTIELSKGEALFTVARDANRPFKVRAGDATVVAVGTAFDVQRDSDRAIVSVTEGRVLVEPAADFLPVAVLREFKPNLRTVRLDAGQQTTAGSAGIAEPSQVEDPAAATAWQFGRLAFHLQPLRYVLEDVNRYASKPIVLEGATLGALVITGTVERENITGWVSSLERAFDLEAVEEYDRIVIRAR
jgi:transmembrane sensor